MDEEQNKQGAAAAAAIDQWFGDLGQQLGPLISTEAMNKIWAQRDVLKGKVAAAIAAAE